MAFAVWLTPANLAFASVAPIAVTPAASASVVMLEPADLQADAEILERAYRELHPGLLRYLSETEAAQAFAQLRREFAVRRSLPDAYLALARFAAKVRCGHSYANFFNQPKELQKRLFESTPRVPFYFSWLDGKMIVTRDFTNPAVLPAGTEVLRINGVPASSILSRLLPLARADGSNLPKRIDQLSVTGDSIYEPFDIYWPLLYPTPERALRLDVKPFQGRTHRRLIVNALTYAQRIAPIKAREAARQGGTDALFEWHDLEDGTGYLRMPTWALFNSRWDWRAWLDERLDQMAMRNAPALIIDIRGNEGGDDVGDEILPRLVSADLPLSELKRLVRYRAVPADLLPYLDTWDSSFKNWGADARELDRPWPTAPPAHYFALAGVDSRVDARTVIHPTQPHFAGRVFVLVDAANSSATFQFAQVVQQQHLGVLVGQPTGGNRRGINGGAFFFVRLPHSKVELDLPLIGQFPAGPEPDEGLTPDLVIHPSLESIASHTDPIMAAVTKLLRSGT